MIQFRGCVAHCGLTKSDMKEVIKKPLENAPKRIGDDKNANDANYKINTTNVDSNLELQRGNHFLRLNIRLS